MSDALEARLLALRREEPEEENRYVREALAREERNLEQVSPIVWFQAPKGWKASSFVEKVFNTLAGGENANNDGSGSGDFDRSPGSNGGPYPGRRSEGVR